MKLQLFIPATLLVSVALVPLMKIRRREQVNEDKRGMLMDIKLRVTEDVLEEYKTELIGIDDLIAQKKRQVSETQTDVDATQQRRDALKNEAEICAGLKKSGTDELATVETELNHLQASVEKEKADWAKEVATLKSQLATQSPVCNFLRIDAQGGSAFCKQEAPKVEAPKPEAPKVEAPKPEAPKVEAPKPEVPKVEAPKPEAPKVEAPQPEAPKVVAPQPEAPNVEAPQPEAPKVEAPQPEAPKVEAPQPEAPKVEAPKQEEPKAEAPKQEEPKAEAPQQ